MKRVFLPFMLKDGKVVPHTHPVFTGEIAYDLTQTQEINVCPTFGCREFASEGEIYAALHDYMREHIGEGIERLPVEPLIVLPVVRMNVPSAARAVKKSVKGIQPSKAKAK